MKKKILILQTGGTIGMMASQNSQGALKPMLKGQDFLKIVPELSKMAKVSTLLIDNIDSANVTPRHWIKWLGELKKKYKDFDGFVVTHGTDSMVYTCSAFSFALENISKPIVFTGSQRPLGLIRSDGPMNLINSVETAIRGPLGVTLCFGNKLLRGVRATKLSATDYVAFESFNEAPLATMGVDYESHWVDEKNKSRQPQWKSVFNEKVFCFKIFPGISGEILLSTIRAKSCEGIVLEAYGSGNVPNLDSSVLAMIKEARKLSKPVVIASQCPHGRVSLEKYECGIEALNNGAISGGDMTREACVVKLMHGLGRGLRDRNLKQYFLKNICQERSY